MKTLVITPQNLPTRPDQMAGFWQRFGMFLKALGQISDEIHIACLTAVEISAAALATLAESLSRERGVPTKISTLQSPASVSEHGYPGGVFSAFKQPAYRDFCSTDQINALARLLDDKFDIVFAHRLASMLALLETNRRPANLFFDLDDVEDRVLYRRIAASLASRRSLAFIPALRRAEADAISQSRLTFVCSEADRSYIQTFASVANVAAIPNTSAAPETPPGLVDEPTILYVGTYNYPPNVDAAERLITRVLPLVRTQLPRTNLFIAGYEDFKIPCRASNPQNVQFLGFVPDLDALYRRSRMVCCPLTVAGGTRIKLIEAAAQARPMVSTTLGAEGLEFRDEKEVVFADSDEEIAGACVRFLSDDSEALRFGEAARHRMLEYYRPEHIIEKIEASIRAKIT